MVLLKHKFLRLFFVMFSLIGVTVSPSNFQEEVKANTSEETLVTSYTPNSLITSSTYQKYENDEWLLTLGSSNGIGASNSYASRLTLGTYASLMAFDSSITSQSQHLSALILKTPLTNLSSISLSRGSSYGGYLSTDTYLVKASSLNSNYELVTMIDSINTTLTSYSFLVIEESCYYALVFYNPSGSFIMGGVNLNFYSKLVQRYTKVTSDSQLYFGATYTLVDEVNQQAISINKITNGYRGMPISIEDSQIESHDDILAFTLDIGSLIDTYSLKLIKGAHPNHYLSITLEEGLTTSEYNNDYSAITINISASSFYVQSENRFITYDEKTNIFMTSLSTSPLSLYMLDQPIDHYEEVRLFSSQVLMRGENAEGKCEETYFYLNSVYERLSKEGRTLLLNSTGEMDIECKERIIYLENWYFTTKKVQHLELTVPNNLMSMWILLGMTSFSSTFYFLYLRKKQL